SRKRSTIPDHGQDCREGDPKVPDIYLRAVVGGEEPERQGSETTDGKGSPGHVEIRSADARGIHQQSGGSHRQQNVRMRHDSIMIRNNSIGWVLLLASAALLAIPNAQSKPPTAKKKGKPA